MDLAELKIGKFIDDHSGDMITTLASLVRIPSVRGEAEDGCPFGREPARALEKFLEIAKDMGFTVKNHENYVGTIDYYPEGKPTLGILCHLDVVPVGDGWATPPFELTLKGGYLYGRGAIDDKGPAVSVLYAMYALKKSGVHLSQNVRFIVGTDEENGSGDLAYYRKKEALPARLFTPDGSYPIINIEKGMIRGEFSLPIISKGGKTVLSISGGDVVNAVPGTCTATLRGISENEIARAAKVTGVKFELSEKDDVLTVVCRGKSAHASQPQDGYNAVTAMISMLASLETDDGTAEAFDMLAKLFPYGETDGTSVGVKLNDDVSGALTLVHSIASYDGKKYRGKFDIRFPVSYKVADVREKLEKTFGDAGISLAGFSGVEGHHVDENSDFIKTLLKTYEHVTGKKGRCIAIGGGTYVHETEGGVAFGAEFIGDDNRMHGANERMSLDLFKMNAKMYAEAIINLCK